MSRPEMGAAGTLGGQLGGQDAALTVVDGGVTAAEGFTSAALHCGIKRGEALDLAVIAADRAVPAAGIFTTNLAQAAPVRLSRQHLAQTGGQARAIVVNSGCANACTGTNGEAAAARMAADTAAALGCAPADVLVASTGVIGVALPMDRIGPGIQRAVAGLARRPSTRA
jgi:glutamate N-acetyltransferase/amino-acid N-acetyltransferase